MVGYNFSLNSALSLVGVKGIGLSWLTPPVGHYGGITVKEANVGPSLAAFVRTTRRLVWESRTESPQTIQKCSSVYPSTKQSVNVINNNVQVLTEEQENYKTGGSTR